jgi:uncharacterized protein YdhG (YjbR/CyaY superfamily)
MKELTNKCRNVDEYISMFSKDTQKILEKIRQVIKENAPQAKEIISYQMPAYKLKRIIVYFAAHTNHIGFYPTSSAITAYKKALVSYAPSKGSVKFPFDKPIPYYLIRKIVKYRVKEDSMKLHKSRQ